MLKLSNYLAYGSCLAYVLYSGERRGETLDMPSHSSRTRRGILATMNSNSNNTPPLKIHQEIIIKFRVKFSVNYKNMLLIKVLVKHFFLSRQLENFSSGILNLVPAIGKQNNLKDTLYWEKNYLLKEVWCFLILKYLSHFRLAYQNSEISTKIIEKMAVFVVSYSIHIKSLFSRFLRL